MPGRLCHHRKTGRRAGHRLQRHQCDDPVLCQGLFAIEGLHRTAQHGAVAHRREQHAGQPHIHAEGGSAVRFGRNVGPVYGLSDQLPVLGIFERHRGRGARGGIPGQCTVGGLFAGGMLHHAVHHGELGGGQAPCVCRGVQKAGAGRSGCHAQRVPQIGNRGGAAGRIRAEFAGDFADHPFARAHDGGLFRAFAGQRVKRQRAHEHRHIAVNRIGAGLLQTHALERHIQLLGREHGQGGMNALPHLAAWHGQDDIAGGGDLDPAVQRHIALCRQHQRAGTQARARRCDTPAHHQRTAYAQGAQYPGAALHAAPPAAR